MTEEVIVKIIESQSPLLSFGNWIAIIIAIASFVGGLVALHHNRKMKILEFKKETYIEILNSTWDAIAYMSDYDARMVLNKNSSKLHMFSKRPIINMYAIVSENILEYKNLKIEGQHDKSIQNLMIFEAMLRKDLGVESFTEYKKDYRQARKNDIPSSTSTDCQ